MTLFEFDAEYRKNGIELLAGADEAGRGPLAGPVYAAAVILPPDFYVPEINDSKKLSEKKREKLFSVITENALAYGIASVSAKEIDEINILNAAMLAMKRAIEKMELTPSLCLIDGNRCPETDTPCEYVIKGDAKSQSIAAASILAKVARDRYLTEEMAKKYPEYEFQKHKAYPTKRHRELIKIHGTCPEHRLTFNLLGDK